MCESQDASDTIPLWVIIASAHVLWIRSTVWVLGHHQVSQTLFKHICVSLFCSETHSLCAFLSVPINSYSRSLLPPSGGIHRDSLISVKESLVSLSLSLSLSVFKNERQWMTGQLHHSLGYSGFCISLLKSVLFLILRKNVWYFE